MVRRIGMGAGGSSVFFSFSALLHYKQALFCDSSGKSYTEEKKKCADIYYHSNIQSNAHTFYTLKRMERASERANECTRALQKYSRLT